MLVGVHFIRWIRIDPLFEKPETDWFIALSTFVAIGQGN